MNTTTSTFGSDTVLFESSSHNDIGLIFVDDATYEFVGGGMAANGI